MRRGGDEQRPEDVLMSVLPGIGYFIVAPRGDDGLLLQPL